jgi:hypothetical protein
MVGAYYVGSKPIIGVIFSNFQYVERRIAFVK